jgi:uncharacterized protein YoxC
MIPAIFGAIPAIIIAINTNRLIAYRVDELSRKVEKHNEVVERTFKLEGDTDTLFKKQDELRDDIRRLQDLIQQD